MPTPFRIAIVGGGIGGLSAAIALRKDNRDITVFEQSSLHREIGATISLQPNAAKIVELEWDMEESLKKKGSMVDQGFQIYNLAGLLQMSVPLSTKSVYGSERLLFHRVDLHDALKQRATSVDYPGQPAHIRSSCRVVSCDCEKGRLKLDDGSVVAADLIIGADGIKSVIRHAVLGEHVPARPTGHSAYRMIIPVELLMKEKSFVDVIDPRKSVTTMVLGHDRRLIMGPARNASIYSVVAMVPDAEMDETSAGSSWSTAGDLQKMLQTFKSFPSWATAPLALAREAGLWQLRDLDPLRTWYKFRAILIGDAAHAMLPTQGQGASQSVEDAEALGAFFAEIEDGDVSPSKVEEINKMVFECRYDRATTIQAYSRQTAKPATDANTAKITMKPHQFMDYNCRYQGALEWRKGQQQEKLLKGQAITLAMETLSVEG